MSWSLKLDEPIALAKGEPLRTLRNAADYIKSLPTPRSKKHWETAMAYLLAAADNGGSIMTARIAMTQALYAGHCRYQAILVRSPDMPDRAVQL